MNVVHLSIIIYICILTPCIISDKQCQADGIVGCWCGFNLECSSNYTGEYVPVFSKSIERRNVFLVIINNMYYII